MSGLHCINMAAASLSLTEIWHSGQAFALLDDAHATTAQSRLYLDLQEIRVCRSAAEWPDWMAGLECAVQDGLYALALLSYESGAQSQGIPVEAATVVSRVALFRSCHHLTATEVGALLAGADCNAADTPSAGVAGLRSSVDAQQFHSAIARIQSYIAAGDTYQVNYTYRLHFDAYGDPVALYRRLRARQPVPYGALICLDSNEAVLSMSPELFVRHHAGQLQARPMKGTAAASGDAEHDRETARQLAADPKNRAENLMIVDLLRNDLGRIAETGSVQVPQLFEVSRFSSVLQMTSTIHARLRSGLGLGEILTALFPCGSITGAPKRRTMEIIHEVESSPRGLYTGAIGWFDPPQLVDVPGDFCLSVPIRTLQLQRASSSAPALPFWQGVMGVGAGIVYDSVAADELAECRLKAGFLTGLTAGFELFETMYATREQGCRHWPRHLQRLRASALYFGFCWDEAALHDEVQRACAGLPAATPCRLRLALQPSGSVQISSGVLNPLADLPSVVLAPETTCSADLFLRHKTSIRQRYDAAWKAAEAQGAFDMLFFNEQGHLTEGGRSNVFIRRQGRWLTPPLTDGVLPGVMRSVLLEDAGLQVQEQSLTRADLLQAEQIMLCNALRGAFTVRLLPQPV